MAITITPPKTGFTVVQNKFMEADSISLTDKMVFIYLASRPQNWQVNVKHIGKILSVSPRTIQRSLKALEDAGFLQRSQQGRTTGGTFGRVDFQLSWEPALHRATNPPCDIYGSTVNVALNKKDSNNTEYNNKTEQGGSHNLTNNPVTSPTASSPNSYTPEFEAVWQEYARKEDKGRAFKNYKKRVRSHGEVSVVSAIRAYMQQREREVHDGSSHKYTKKLGNFLGEDATYEQYLPQQIPDSAWKDANVPWSRGLKVARSGDEIVWSDGIRHPVGTKRINKQGRIIKSV